MQAPVTAWPRQWARLGASQSDTRDNLSHELLDLVKVMQVPNPVASTARTTKRQGPLSDWASLAGHRTGSQHRGTARAWLTCYLSGVTRTMTSIMLPNHCCD